VYVLLNRLRQQLNDPLLEYQSGFRPGRGTPEHMFTIRRLCELASDHHPPLFAAFIDLKKAFDSVNREALWHILANRGINEHLIALIKDLYTGTEACVVANGCESEWFQMHSGVRQGCPLSPLLFNVYIDHIFRCALAKLPPDNGYNIAYHIDGHLTAPPAGCRSSFSLPSLLYADDITATAPSAAALRRLLLAIEGECRAWGLPIHYDKTKIVVFGSSTPTPPPSMQLAHGSVAYADHMTYLGTSLQSDGALELELNKRIGMAWANFKAFDRRVWRSRAIGPAFKAEIYKAIVIPTLLYGAESWALSAPQTHRLNVFNTTCLRRMLHVKRSDHKPNAELYEEAGVPATSEAARKHRLRWLGHAARAADGRIHKRLLFAHGVHSQVITNAIPEAVAAAAAAARGLAPAAHAPQVQLPPQASQPRRGGKEGKWVKLVIADLEAGNVREWYTRCQNRKEWRSIAAGVAMNTII
jgi:hypothetical protein